MFINQKNLQTISKKTNSIMGMTIHRKWMDSRKLMIRFLKMKMIWISILRTQVHIDRSTIQVILGMKMPKKEVKRKSFT